MNKIPVTIIGMGRIGGYIATLLHRSKRYDVLGVDINEEALSSYHDQFETQRLDDSDYGKVLNGRKAVISASGFSDNPTIAKYALQEGCSYFDLTEDVSCTQEIKRIASKAEPNQVFVPQCGLAPGFVGIVANSFLTEFESLDTLKLRVGALPEFPANQMMYNLTWSTEGLVNEYANPCEAIKHYDLTKIEPLEGRETFSISGVEYEAFNTSGGLGSLCQQLQGKVRDLTYKTVRYPGHCHLMRFLFRDLRLGEAGDRRNMLLEILNSSVAVTKQDFVLVSVVATGWNAGVLEQKTRTFLIPHHSQSSAIQISTASGLCAVLDLVMTDQISGRGFLGQEAIPLETFLKNEFAKPYRSAELT